MAINLSTLVNQTNPLQLCKAWVSFAGNGSILASYGVSSVTRTAQGKYTISWSSGTFQDANYAIAAMPMLDAGGVTNVVNYPISTPQTQNSVQIVVSQTANYAAYVDSLVGLIAFGN